MAFDLDKLTLGELDYLEKTSGLGLSEIAKNESPKGGFLMALVVITKRRSGFPTYSTVEASQLGVAAAQEIIKALTEDDADSGKDAGDETPTSPPSSSTSASDPTTTSD